MNIREFLLEKPQENNIISFLQDEVSQNKSQNTNEYLASLKNEAIDDFYKNKDKYAKEYEKHNIKDQNLTNPLGYIGEYKRDLYDYNKNPSMNADDLSDYILDKQSKFNASKPIFTDNNEVARKNNQFMRDLGDELQKSGRGKLLQDDDGSYWVQDNNGNYSKVQGSTMGNLYRGIRDNGASVALGTAGAIGGSMLGGGVGMVAGGALGASLGTGYDYYGNTKDTNQDANLKEALMLMGENAGLSLIGDAAFAGVAKGARVLKNTYNMTKSGTQAGKDMIDGMAVNGNHLKENIGDRLRKISPSVLNDLTSQGNETSKAYVRELIESGNGNYDEILQKSRTMPLEVNQGNALVDGVASKIKDFSNTAKNGFVKNTADSVTNSLNNLSKNIGSKEAALNQQDLINLSFVNDDLANMARSVLANDPKMANKVANSLYLQDEAILKELNLNNTPKADELYVLRDARAKRAYDEFGEGLEKLDKLNPNGIKIDKKVLNDLIQNADFFGQNIPKALKDFLKELNSNTPMSATKLNTRIKELSEEIKTNKSYDFNRFLENLKQNLLDSMIKNATNPQEAKNILSKIRRDYADFKVYDKSKLGEKLKGSEKNISKDIDKILNETNPKKNYEAITKGFNDDEIKVLDNQIITRALEKNKINIGDANNPKFVVNYKAVMDNFENFKPKSKSGQEKIEVLKMIGDVRANFEIVMEGILNSKAKELGHGISTNFIERAKTMLVNNFTDYIAFYFMRLWEVGKRAGTRIQMRRAFANINTLQDFNQASKNFIESIKDKILKEEAQNARKEFDSKIKDLVKGDNFFMDKADPSKAKSDLNVTISVSPNVRNLAKLTNDEIIADLEYLANKHNEMFKKPSDVFKLIKEIKENPTFFYKNNRMDIALIAKRLNDNKLGKLGVNKDTGEVRHITKVKEKDLARLEKVSKKNTKENVGIIQTFIQPGSKNENSLNGLPNISNSTQAKPKKNLMEDIKENIEAKEVEKKNKKSVKQKLDKKIQDDKKASEDILKRYNNFLKENKNNKLDFLDKMNLNTVEYNLTRQMVINAKESTNKGIKKDIPSALRGKIEQELNIQPLKEFGENYTEYYHDGKGALQKLLIEKQGQVAGAFHRKDLGDIDLVWGDGNFGLSHIINRREEDFIKQGLNKIEAKNKALNFIKEIENIINNGNVKKGNNRAFIDTKNSRVMVALDYKGKDKKWIITAYNFY
ncbi:hypothetical protein KJQ68_00100 [Campylobacter coli]|uniref:Phage-Barnase-EndoU-ColicinE5/D-RelE-like nuclease domain-containing protein n=1 Tax=Campylobacter jejuni TaxID=197 RepID=A0A698FEG6_CAMJU|nr:hypothetical protein [Campylobacter coli]